MHSSPSLMNAMVITGQILKSIFIIIMIALALSLFGFFETNSQAKNDNTQLKNSVENINVQNEIIKWIKKSEESIKRNIKKIAKLENGLNLYSFQYKSEPTIYVGFLAHELAQNSKFKQHVIHMGEGHYAIHYEKLGYQTITLKTWQQSGINALKKSKNIANRK